jgi:phage repressor protein C with HTH and peptisase S24 domain
MATSIGRGAIVGVDTSEEHRKCFINGEVYCIGYENPDIYPTLYRFISTGMDTVRLASDNKNHPSYDLEKRDIMPKIIGRVVWAIQKFD